MPSKFLNANTDNTLGGNNSSNVNVPSQKAVKDYVDGKLYNEKFGNGLALQTNTSAAAAVTASMTNYELKTNGRVSVKFKYANSASSTLNVNGTGAKDIYYFATAGNTTATAMPANYIKAGDVATFVYDGSHYVLTDIKRFALSLNVSGSTTAGTTGAQSASVSGTITIGTGSGTANYTPSGTITNGSITTSGGSTVNNLLTTSSTFTATGTAATTKKLSVTIPANSVVTGSGGTSSNMITSNVAPSATEFLTGVTVSNVATGGTSVNVHAALSGNPATTLTTDTTGDTDVLTASSSGSAASTTHTHSVSATATAKVDAYTAVASTTYKTLSTTTQTNGTAASCSLTATQLSGDDYDLKLSFTPNQLPTLATTVATGFTTSGATSSNGVISARTYTTSEVAAQAHTHEATATESTAQTVITGVTKKKISASTTAPSVNLSTPATAGANDVTVIGSVTTGSPTVTPTSKFGVGFASEPTLSQANAVASLTTGAPTLTISTTTDSGGVRIPTNAISSVSVTPASDTPTASAVGSIGTITQDTSTFAGDGVELTASHSLTADSHTHSIPSLTVTGTATE